MARVCCYYTTGSGLSKMRALVLAELERSPRPGTPYAIELAKVRASTLPGNRREYTREGVREYGSTGGEEG